MSQNITYLICAISSGGPANFLGARALDAAKRIEPTVKTIRRALWAICIGYKYIIGDI